MVSNTKQYIGNYFIAKMPIGVHSRITLFSCISLVSLFQWICIYSSSTPIL